MDGWMYIYIYNKYIHIYNIHTYIHTNIHTYKHTYIYIYIYLKVSQLLLALATCSETKTCIWLSFKASSYYIRYSFMTLDSLCSICNKSVSYRNSIACNLCLTQTHFTYNNLNFVDGQVIKKANKSWFYVQKSKNIFPFSNINHYKLSLTVKYR